MKIMLVEDSTTMSRIECTILGQLGVEEIVEAIDDLPLDLQSKLLRVLPENTIVPVGSS